MRSSSLYDILKLSKRTSPPKLFRFDCMTLYKSSGSNKARRDCGGLYIRLLPHPQRNQVQGHQIYMALCFWYLFSVRVIISVHQISHFLQGARKKQPCLSGRVVIYPLVGNFSHLLSFLSFLELQFFPYFASKLYNSYCT